MNLEKEAICLVGTLTSEAEFESIQSRSRVKAAISPNNMQANIYASLAECCEDVSCISYPAVASWPKGCVIATGGKKRMKSGLAVKQIFMLNLPVLKQISVFVSMLFSLLSWAGKRREKKRYILTYADFAEYCLPALWVGKILNIPVCLFLTELPGYAHYKTGRLSLRDRLIIQSERFKRGLYKHYDGFVFVSKHSQNAVGVENRPWTVVEGFAESALFNCETIKKEEKRTAMYAGSLGAAYNIPMLCDAFRLLEGDYRLVICGDGKYRRYVEQAEQQDERICYLGRLPREEVVRLERRCHLLIHAKNSSDEHSRYAFSSKILEYMASGTPVLTTRVDGVPDEYYENAFVVEERGVKALAEALEDSLSLPLSCLQNMGEKARRFLMEEKNLKAQGQKIMNMFRSI